MLERVEAGSGLTRRTRLRWLGALLIGVAALAHADVAVPPLEARVTDLTGTLSASQQASLEQKLRDYESRKGSQIAVLLVPTTQPETIEQYSIRVVEDWKLGRKGVDDGALLLVAMRDRQARIEVGRGLEGALPDVIAKRIIVDIVRPRFRQGDYYGGIDAGLDAIISTIEGEPLPAPPPSGGGGGGDWETAMGIAFLVALVSGGLMRRLFGRLIGATVTGAAIAGIIWLITQTLLVALFLGVFMFVFTLVGGLGGFGPGGFGRGWGGGGWTSGGWGGGIGGGGGGFGGGGGTFGGGGASGNW